MRKVETAALLVRSVPFGEADLVATFFTETDGKLSAIVRGARRSSKRFAGALEPIHELFITLDDKGKELGTLKEARIARARVGVTADLARMEAAGQALRWVRHLCPARTPEPAAWASLSALLDGLDTATGDAILSSLAVFGLRLLADVGYGLDLERCARCGRVCPEGRAAYVDAGAGGLVCSSCGGARRTMSGELRTAAIAALAAFAARSSGRAGVPALAAFAARSSGRAGVPALSGDATLDAEQASAMVAIVEDAMAAHTDFDSSR